MGAVGPDADAYIQRLQSLGIDTTGVYRSQRPTATFTVMTDSADNQVGGFYPGAMADNPRLHLDRWQDRPALVVVTPNDPTAMRQQVAECQQYHLRLLYDVGQQANNLDPADIRAGVQAAELLIANDYEMAVLSDKTGWNLDRLRQMVPLLITTLGEQGAVIEGNRVATPIHITSATPTQVIDPTGAGDAFRAGFLYGYVRGRDLTVCGQMGAVAAVYAVETQGTQEHTFTRAEFCARYQQTYQQTIEL
jgi:adenosine kinase